MEDPLMCEIDWGPVWAHLGLSLLPPLDRATGPSRFRHYGARCLVNAGCWMHWMRSLCAAPRFAGKGAAATSDR